MLTRNILQNAAAIACAFGVLAWQPASAQDAGWTVTEVTGGANIELPGRTALPAQADLAVSPGARIATDEGGRLRLTNGTSVMTLSSATEVEIREAPEAGRTSIFQRIGILMLEVERRAREHFEVETPYLSAVVKGTRFSVSVADAGAAVHVTDGMVEVSAPAAGRPLLVHPGQTATIDTHALDTLRLEGGRSQIPLSERSAAAAHQAIGGETTARQVVRRSIGDAAIDIGTATNGLVGSRSRGRPDSVTTAAAAEALGDAAGGRSNALNGVGNALGGVGNGAGGLGNAIGGPGNAAGGLANAIGGPGNAAGGLGNAAGGLGQLTGELGSAAQGVANDAAEAAKNTGKGLGNGLLGL